MPAELRAQHRKLEEKKINEQNQIIARKIINPYGIFVEKNLTIEYIHINKILNEILRTGCMNHKLIKKDALNYLELRKKLQRHKEYFPEPPKYSKFILHLFRLML